MPKLRDAALLLLTFALVCINSTSHAQQQQQQRASASSETRSRTALSADSHLTGVYRIDVASSDKLYSVIAGATSNLPFAEQQRFFIDLAARLTPPDLLAIERRGRTIAIASSRAPRITFQADGITHAETGTNGNTIRTSASINGDRLTVNTSGGTRDRFVVMFDPVGDGDRLRVVRRIYAAELSQPIIINSVYNRISEVAQWSIYGEPQTATASSSPVSPPASSAPLGVAGDETDTLRVALNEWVSATNKRDIDRLSAFYMPILKAYYLTRNVPRSFVRNDKSSAFKRADVLSVQADEPEILLSEHAGTAVMRFRKNYVIESGRQRKSGEVIQELRWQKTGTGWRITSERDVRVIR
jgi:hypothetical protein